MSSHPESLQSVPRAALSDCFDISAPFSGYIFTFTYSKCQTYQCVHRHVADFSVCLWGGADHLW